MFKRDQIHGDIEFSSAELKLIDSKAFIRQRYIKQLGFVECEYPGATHSRMAHALGVCACVTDMYRAVIANNPAFYRDGDLELLRMCALVHDMGHSPFSHSGESLSSITHEERLYGILESEQKNIILPNMYDIPAWELVYQVYNGTGLVYMSDKHLMSLHSFMDNVVDADKLDYLERDSVNCGVSYGYYDRDGLVNNLTMIPGKNGLEEIAILLNGVQALESFILARYYMFSRIYMSPMERLRRYLYFKEMQSLLPDGMFPDNTKKFLQLDDTKYTRRLKCLQELDYELVYDGEYDIEVKQLLDKSLGGYLICDTPRQAIFRKETDDNPIQIVDSLLDRVIPCNQASPILQGIGGVYIHKLRYYAESRLASSLRDEIVKLLRGGSFLGNNQ